VEGEEEQLKEIVLLRRAVDVKPEEQSAMLMSFAFFFFVLSGYFVLRPIRDAVAAASGVQQLPWLFTGTLTATLLFNPLFSALVVRYPARKFVPLSFQFFISNLLLFYVLMLARRRIGDGHLDRPQLLRVDERARLLRHVDLLVLHGRRLSQRSG
jgi:ATP/ADP translocase